MESVKRYRVVWTMEFLTVDGRETEFLYTLADLASSMSDGEWLADLTIEESDVLEVVLKEGDDQYNIR